MGQNNLEQNVGQGAGQPSDQSVQDQQGQQNLQQGQQQQQSGNLPEGFMRAEDVPPELKANYDHMVKAYTQKRQEETSQVRNLESRLQQAEQQLSLYQEKAGQLDRLLQNPSFNTWARTEYEKGQNIGSQGGYGDEHIFDEYDDPEAVKGIVDAVTQRVAKMIEPIQQTMATTRQEADFQALVSLAKENGWQDPVALRDSIDYNMRRYGINVQDAYRMAVGQQAMSGITTRRPINQPFQQQSQQGQIEGGQQGSQQQTNFGIPIVGNRGNVTNPPSSTQTTRNPLASKTAVEAALEERRGGKTPREIPIDDIVKQVVNDMNNNGANIDLRDL